MVACFPRKTAIPACAAILPRSANVASVSLILLLKGALRGDPSSNCEPLSGPIAFEKKGRGPPKEAQSLHG